MAKVQVGNLEIDEEELRASLKLRETVGAILKNPKARRLMLQAEKAQNPKAEIPELDQPDPLEEIKSATDKRIDALTAALEADKTARESEKNLRTLETSIDSGIAALKRDHRWLDGTEAEVRKIMNDEGITKPEIAWNVFQARHPPSSLMPAAGATGAWGFMDAPAEGSDAGEDIQKLIASKGENESIIRKMTNQALKEVRAA